VLIAELQQLIKIMIFRKIPLAWLQLSFSKAKLLTAIAGIVFACVLMFMQFGFQEALFDSATLVHRKMSGDLFVISTQSENLIAMKPFTRRLLYQTKNNPDVLNVSPVYMGLAPWKNPENGKERSIFIMGFETDKARLDLPGIAENLSKTSTENVVIFDKMSRPEFGIDSEKVNRNERVSAEVLKRRVDVKGLFELGASFAADGNFITGDLNFLRLFPGREAGEIDLGIIELAPNADVKKVQSALKKSLPKDVKIFTKDEFVAFERTYWETATAIGFVFNFGAVLGLIVGIIITYQVLYTDVVNHLAEYATLKAMGYTNFYLTKVVLQEAIILSLLGFFPGFLVALILYFLASSGSGLAISMTFNRAATVFILAVLMCFISGLIAMRKLKQADPADIF
jgi:putative ABC transport system permease protein